MYVLLLVMRLKETKFEYRRNVFRSQKSLIRGRIAYRLTTLESTPSSADNKAESENKTQQENLLIRERMLKKYAKKIAIIYTLDNKIGDFVPDGLVPESILLRNHELWIMEKPDNEGERDYFRLFRVGLKVDG